MLGMLSVVVGSKLITGLDGVLFKWTVGTLRSNTAPFLSYNSLIPFIFVVMVSGKYLLKIFQTNPTPWNSLSKVS
jgi:hypothetical protein